VALTAPCGGALDAASPAAKRRFADAVDAIAAALPPEARILKQAVAERVAELFGATFADETLAALPAGVTAQIRKQNPNARRFVAPWTRRRVVRDARALRSTLAAADLDAAGREAVFARARSRLETPERELQVDALFERFDRLRLLLTLLSNAARLDAGDARSAAPGLALRSESERRVLAPLTARLARHALPLHRDAEPPSLAP
jgi:hypothetical protein